MTAARRLREQTNSQFESRGAGARRPAWIVQSSLTSHTLPPLGQRVEPQHNRAGRTALPSGTPLGRLACVGSRAEYACGESM